MDSREASKLAMGEGRQNKYSWCSRRGGTNEAWCLSTGPSGARGTYYTYSERTTTTTTTTATTTTTTTNNNNNNNNNNKNNKPEEKITIQILEATGLMFMRLIFFNGFSWTKHYSWRACFFSTYLILIQRDEVYLILTSAPKNNRFVSSPKNKTFRTKKTKTKKYNRQKKDRHQEIIEP